MNTQRRLLLGAGAALALPFWIARAFEEEPAPQHATEPTPKPTTLAEAGQRARANGKPLLVVFTDPEGAQGQAGAVWGEYFMHATQDAWLDLALVEVACLPRAAVAAAKPSSAEVGPRWAVVIETDGKGGGPRSVAGPLPEVTYRDESGERVQRVRTRAAALAGLVRAAILRDDATLERRAKQSLASLPNAMMGEEFGRHEAVLGQESHVRLVDLDRFAALVRSESPAARLDRLALAARIRLFEQDPAGARWSTTSNNCPPCGMGFVPAESRYFLRFYAE